MCTESSPFLPPSSPAEALTSPVSLLTPPVLLNKTLVAGALLAAPLILDGGCCASFNVTLVSSNLPCVVATIPSGDVFAHVTATCNATLDRTVNYTTVLRAYNIRNTNLNSTFTLTMAVYDVPTLTYPPLATVRESRPVGYPVLNITASDAGVRYSMLPCNGSAVFAVNATTGVITTTKKLDWEEDAHVYDLLIQAYVGGIYPVTVDAEIEVELM